jgi:hypothetical protein
MIDWNKPIRDRETSQKLHYVGLDQDGKHVVQYPNKFLLTYESGTVAIENIPDPPPKTFDPDKLRRMIAVCHANPDEQLVCAETNRGEPRYNAVESPINNEFFAFDKDGSLCVCNFSGYENGGVPWLNSHLPEPESLTLYVVACKYGGISLYESPLQAADYAKRHRESGNLYGTATARVLPVV